MTRRALILAAHLAVISLCRNLPAQPSLSHVTPSAIHPSQPTEVTLHGAKLDEPLSIWTSFPAKLEVIAPADGKKVNTKIVCKITPEAGTTVGIGGIIVGTKAAVSNTLLLTIDDLPTIAEGSNQSLAGAQEITLPTAIDGVSQNQTSDFYKFAAKSGQRVTVEVIARRAGSPLDAVVWLRDNSGRELAYMDDDDLGADSKLGYVIPSDGEYVVEIRDNAYQAGRRYRLRVGEFPVVSSAYPLGGQVGTTTRFDFIGPADLSAEPAEIALPSTTSGQTGIAAVYKAGKTSALVTVAASDLPNALEAEPNNDGKTATQITLPCAINGRLQENADADHFIFDASKGQRIAFRAISHSLGSPAYVFMRLQKPDGGKLAESGVSESQEETLTYTFPEDGKYVLRVADLLQHGGPEFAYRIEARPPQPFSLSLKADKNGRYQYVASKDGAVSVDIQCGRNGYDGPVTLSAEANGKQLTVYRNVIAEKQAAIKIIIAMPPEFDEGNLGVVTIVGKAKVGDKEVTASLSSSALVRTKMTQLVRSPAWHDGIVAVATGAPPAPIFTVTPDKVTVAIAGDADQVKFSLAMERKHKDFKEALFVAVEGLPEGLTAAVKRNGNGPKETYEVTVNGTKNLAAGSHVLRLLSYGELNARGQKTVNEVTITR